MAVTLPTATKNAMLTALQGLIDGGSGAGYMEIGTTAFGTILVTLTFSDPCGSVSGGILALTTPISATASNTGAAATARVKDSSGTVVITSMSVSTSGADVNLSSTSVTSGQTVSFPTTAQFTM